MLRNNSSEQIHKPSVYFTGDVLALVRATNQMFKQNKERSQLVMLIVSQSIFNSFPKFMRNSLINNSVV